MNRLLTVAVVALSIVACEGPADRAIRLQREVDRATLYTYAARLRLDSVAAAHPDSPTHPDLARFRDSLTAAQAREGRLREELSSALGGR